MYEIREILQKAVSKDVPNFFRMGYYVTFSGQPLPDMPLDQLNDFLLKYLDENFMLEFISNARQRWNTRPASPTRTWQRPWRLWKRRFLCTNGRS